MAIAGSTADQWPRSVYGSDAVTIEELGESIWGGLERLDDRLTLRPAEILWAVRHEMARTVEDILARRTRALFLNAQAALDIAPAVAAWMAKEMGHEQAWETEQFAKFRETAETFCL